MIVATPARHSQSKEILAGGSSGLIDTKMRVGVRNTDHGDAEVLGAGNHLANVQEDIAALKTEMTALRQAGPIA
jgi:hypothetical protein